MVTDVITIYSQLDTSGELRQSSAQEVKIVANAIRRGMLLLESSDSFFVVEESDYRNDMQHRGFIHPYSIRVQFKKF